MSDHPALTRRDVLRTGTTVTIAGVGVALLAGCGGGGADTGKAAPAPTLTDAAATQVAAAITAKEVPVGKAKILTDAGVILAQPSEGSYVVYSDVCPHAGGKITKISSRGNLTCPLHGSEFDPASGDVKVGPANTGLKPGKVKVDGGKASIA